MGIMLKVDKNFANFMWKEEGSCEKLEQLKVFQVFGSTMNMKRIE